jgi:hypothetical protein
VSLQSPKLLNWRPPGWKIGGRLPILLVLRRLVVATSVPPLCQLYQFYYHLVARILVLVLRRHGDVRSVYLRQGCAEDEIEPGVSDLDLGVFAEGAEDVTAPYARAYRRAALLTIVPERSLEVYDACQLPRQYTESPFYRAKFSEGRVGWRLLHGPDVLRALPEPSTAERALAAYSRLQAFWGYFAVGLLQEPNRNQRDAIFINSICCKAITEVARAYGVLVAGRTFTGRSSVRSQAGEYLPGEFHGAVEVAEAVSRQRCLTAPKDILDISLSFSVKLIQSLVDESRERPPFDPVTGGESDLGFLYANLEGFDRTRGCLEHVRRELNGWGAAFQGLSIIPSLWFDSDEWLVLIDIDPASPPPVAALRSLSSLFPAAETACDTRLWPYLVTGDAALSLGTRRLERSFLRMLHPHVQPDAFLGAARPDLRVAGRHREARVAVSALCLDLVRETREMVSSAPGEAPMGARSAKLKQLRMAESALRTDRGQGD